MEFEIIIKQIENGETVSEQSIKKICVEKPETLLDVGFRHAEQVKIINDIQQVYIPLQCQLLAESHDYCPNCKKKAKKNGRHPATFHSSLGDYKFKMQSYNCVHCGWQEKPTIHGEFGTNVHPDLLKLQAFHGAKAPYKEAQSVLNEFSACKRSVNNHVKISEATNKIGEILDQLKAEESVENVKPVKSIYLHVDGGHIKDKGREKRSFEAMIATVFKPESYHQISDKVRKIKGKHIAASALDDGGNQINQFVLKAAQKEGLGIKTKVIAFSDGAKNCWNIVDSLAPYCGKIVKILDWFHIRQAYDKAMSALPDYKDELQSSKYKVWHGLKKDSTKKLANLIEVLKQNEVPETKIDKVIFIKNYLTNNSDKIVNYMKRKNKGLPYTSNVAEATVESQINVRFKRKQKMQWSRENAHNVLQLRTTVASDEWVKYQSQLDEKLVQKAA